MAMSRQGWAREIPGAKRTLERAVARKSFLRKRWFIDNPRVFLIWSRDCIDREGKVNLGLAALPPDLARQADPVFSTLLANGLLFLQGVQQRLRAFDGAL